MDFLVPGGEIVSAFECSDSVIFCSLCRLNGKFCLRACLPVHCRWGTLSKPRFRLRLPVVVTPSWGRPRDYSEFMEANIDVDKHPFAAPELLLEGFKAYNLDQGLWNTYRNTGWCEVNGGIVDVNDAGRIALVI